MATSFLKKILGKIAANPYVERAAKGIGLNEMGYSEYGAGGQTKLTGVTPNSYDYWSSMSPQERSGKLNVGTSRAPGTNEGVQRLSSGVAFPAGVSYYNPSQSSAGRTTAGRQSSNTATNTASYNATEEPQVLEQVYVPNTRIYNGVEYDLNNTNDYRNLLAAQLADLDAQNREGLDVLNRNMQSATGYSNRNQDINLNNVIETSTIGQQKKSLLDKITENLRSLAEQEKTNTQNIGAYYSGLGDITQSSQGYRVGEETRKFDESEQKVNEQKATGMNALERALSDFLYQDNSSRNQLARNYSSARDTASNNLASQIGSVGDTINKLKLDYANAQYAGQDPTYIRQAIDANTNIFNALKNVNSNNLFKRLGASGNDVDEDAILRYLNPQGV